MLRPKDQNVSTLKTLNLEGTSISSSSFREILSSLDVTRLEELSIGESCLISGKNALQHSKEYATPFNYSIYEFLASLNLSSLRILSMPQMDLDEEALNYLANWTLPALQSLDLEDNFVSDSYFQRWITSGNMPLLEKLVLNKNSVTTRGIRYLAEQKFSNLHSLCIANNRRLGLKYLDDLSSLNFSRFRQLDLSYNVVSESTFNILFGER